ncbi:MAG: pseudaminic acid synthase [Desulfobulbaceae bacterium]|nr:pseudaminic acid synthase [Desulfobulbaceae bacterium]
MADHVNNFTIAGREIGPGHPVYIIAEMSANHNQSFEQAVEIILAAKKAGADAIKLQTYTPDTITLDADTEPFMVKGTIWQGQKLYDLYRKAYTPWEWQPRLQKIAEEQGIGFFSTPFDATAVDFLQSMSVSAYKVASFEVIDIPLIAKIAKTGRPIIMSTGMASLGEIDEAVRAVRANSASPLALLKCTSAYPAPPNEMNLQTLSHLATTFGVPVGISDHSMSSVVPIVATALGASIIEKHFTLSREVAGPDSAFSLEPDEFSSMVRSVREAEKTLGQISYEVTVAQEDCKRYRRSLFVVEDVKEGERFTEENVRSIRPGDGLLPKYLPQIVGGKARVTIAKGTPFAWNFLA